MEGNANRHSPSTIATFDRFAKYSSSMSDDVMAGRSTTTEVWFDRFAPRSSKTSY